MIGLPIPNPWVLLAALSVAVGAYFYGAHVGKAEEAAKQATQELLLAKITTAVQTTAADAIAGIQIHNTTIKQKTETLTREVPVYADCHNTPDVMRLLNDAIGGQSGAVSSGGGELPAASPAH